MTPDPLILTAVLDAESQARFDALRRAHFPPALNHLAAHVTMFHHLPGDQRDAIVALLADIAAVTSVTTVKVVGLRLLGRGVAFELSSPELATLRGKLATAWSEHLTPQDRQRWRPHVTIQNKVAPSDARELRDDLAATFSPCEVQAEGLALWWYRGGPWEAIKRFDFALQPGYDRGHGN